MGFRGFGRAVWFPHITKGVCSVVLALAAAGWAADGEWPMPALNYQATRFSSLEQISTSTVTNLKVAWTFSTGVNRGHEAAPLVVSNTMFVVTPYPNILYALDPVTGSNKWKYESKPSAAAQGVACCAAPSSPWIGSRR